MARFGDGLAFGPDLLTAAEDAVAQGMAEDEERLVVVGMPEAQPDDVVGLLLTDPYTFPVDAFVERSGEVLPGLPLVGGLAGGQDRGTSRLFLGGKGRPDEVFDDGA